MNLNPTYNTPTIPKPGFREYRNRSAYHAAGKAIAICLGNQQNDLPPVYFQIRINRSLQTINQAGKYDKNHHNAAFAKVEGGLLITDIPDSVDDATKAMSSGGKLAYHQASEADIINLLAGSIAEAHYVASRDGKVITSRLVNLAALHLYCPEPEMAMLHRRIDCMNTTGKDRKQFRLYLQAFHFVNERANWQAIETIARFLLATDKPMVAYDDIISLLNQAALTNNDGLHGKVFYG